MKRVTIDLVYNGVDPQSGTTTARSLLGQLMAQPGGPTSAPVDQKSIMLLSDADLSIINTEASEK